LILAAGLASALINRDELDPREEIERITGKEAAIAYARGLGLGKALKEKHPKTLLALSSGLPSDRLLDDEYMRGLRDGLDGSAAIIGPLTPLPLDNEELAAFPPLDARPDPFRDTPGNSAAGYQKAIDASPSSDLIVFLHGLPWMAEQMPLFAADPASRPLVVAALPAETSESKKLLSEGLLDMVLVNRNLNPEQWNRAPSKDPMAEFESRFSLRQAAAK
jgi:hypothetical protein